MKMISFHSTLVWFLCLGLLSFLQAQASDDDSTRMPWGFLATVDSAGNIAVPAAFVVSPNSPRTNDLFSMHAFAHEFLAPYAGQTINIHRSYPIRVYREQIMARFPLAMQLEARALPAEDFRMTMYCFALFTENAYVIQFLQQKANPNEQASLFKLSPLMCAMYGVRDETAALHLLRVKKLQVQKTDMFGSTALSHAFYGKNTEAIEVILKSNAKISMNAYNKFHQSPFSLAATYQGADSDSIQRILEIIIKDKLGNRKEVNVADPKWRYTPFMLAVRSRNLPAVNAFLAHPKYLGFHKENMFGETVLHMAAVSNDVDLLTLLLKESHGQQQSSNKALFMTPLMAAIQSNALYTAYALINQADFKHDEVNERLETPLVVAIRQKNLELVQAILARVQSKDQQFEHRAIHGQTKHTKKNALMFAIELNQVDILKELLRASKINFKLKDRDKKTVWDYAAGSEEMLALLNAKKAEMRSQNIFVKAGKALGAFGRSFRGKNAPTATSDEEEGVQNK